MTDERTKFEAWIKYETPTAELDRGILDEYVVNGIEARWQGWQARAALASQQKPLDPWHQKDCEYLEQQQKPGHYKDQLIDELDNRSIPAGLDEVARMAKEFMGKATYLHHPDVAPYQGTQNGDSEEAWTNRLWLELILRLVAELTKGQEPFCYISETYEVALFSDAPKKWPDMFPVYRAPVITEPAVPTGWKLVGWLDGRDRFFYADDPMYKHRHDGMREVFAAAPGTTP